jgi:hypothetical protein
VSAEALQKPADARWEMLRECVLYGLLFKAAMADWATLSTMPLKLSYQILLEGLSRFAERKHWLLRQNLRRQGCELLAMRKQGSVYCVQYRLDGYVREALYSIELLKAECQERVRTWVVEQGERTAAGEKRQQNRSGEERKTS